MNIQVKSKNALSGAMDPLRDMNSPVVKRKKIVAPLISLALPNRPSVMKISGRKRPVTTDDSNDNISAKRLTADADVSFVCQTPIHCPISNEAPRFAVAGSIKRIILKNFMCHQHFQIDLNPRVNFIQGVNGSGKSAVQTAIPIVLGDTAKHTNRSEKNEGLIRHGMNTAELTLVFCNVGEYAYEPETFGPEIIIKRIIRSKSSTYKVLTYQGREASAKKCIIADILSSYKIQLGNAVTILNQDLSRSFLTSQSASDTYVMFQKATGLFYHLEKVKKLDKCMLEQAQTLEQKDQACKKIRGEIEELKRLLAISNQIKSRKDKLELLEGELEWSRVNECNKHLDKCKFLNERQEAQIAEKKAKIEELNLKIGKNEEELEKLKREMIEIVSMVGANAEACDKMRAELRAYDMNCQRLSKDMAVLNRMMDMKKSNVEKIKQCLDTIEGRNQQAAWEREANEKELEALNKTVLELEAGLEVYLNDARNFKNTAREHADALTQKGKESNALKSKITVIEEQLKHCGSSEKSNELVRYGRYMPEVMKRIEEAFAAGKFQSKPIGPFGMHIKIKDANWGDVVENTIGIKRMRSFLTCSGKDSDVLMKIFKSVLPQQQWKYMPKITVLEFYKQMPNVSSSQCVQRPYCNIYEYLDITNPTVANFLVMSHMHQILLVDELAACRQLTTDVRNVPCNLLKVIAIDGRDYMPKRPGKSFKTMTQTIHPAQFLCKSNKNIVQELNARKEKLKLEQKNAMEEYNAMKEEWKKMNKLVEETGANVRDTERRIKITRSRRLELQEALNREMPSHQMQTEEMDDIMRELALLEEQKENLEAQKMEQNEKIRNLNLELQIASKDCGNEQQRDLNDKIENTQSRLLALKEELYRHNETLKEQDVKWTAWKADVERKEEMVKIQIERACIIYDGEDVSIKQTKRESAEVQHEIDETIAFINIKEEELGEASDTVQENYDQKVELGGDLINGIAKLKELFQKRNEMRNMRKKMYDDLLKEKTKMVTENFVKILRQRNYKGTLVFDHQKGTLNLLMCSTGEATTAKNHGNGDLNMATIMQSSALSGGERTFSTMALLLALWSTVDMPFYSMDEFDVFMDTMNRQKITELLMDFTMHKSDKQFIFLTPLDISNVTQSPCLKIQK